MDEFVRPINQGSFDKMLHQVVGLSSTRFVASSGNTKAADFIKSQLQGLGFTITDQKFNPTLLAKVRQVRGGVASETSEAAPGNIVGFMEGTDLKHEFVLFGAHYDSVNWEDTSGTAPGVEDNGSGVAAVLLAARALASQKQERPPRRSVVFVAFQAEEVGLLGSKWFVQDLVTKGTFGTCKAALIADEVAYAGRPEHFKKVIFETVGKKPANSAIVDTMAHIAQKDKGIAGFEVNYHGFGSDHMPFLNNGYPAVLLIERDNMWHADHWGHSSRDDFSHVNADFGAALTRLAAKTVMTLASPKA